MNSVQIISLKNVTKTFGNKPAIKNLDLQIDQGSTCGFLGPNGAGKSTTIRIIMSIIRPDSGNVQILGTDALKAKPLIGYLPEERGVYKKMKVKNFLYYMGALKGLNRKNIKYATEYWLDRVQLPTVLNQRCEELSKGMQQKIQFIASIIHNPKVIILDEPFSGLDPVNAQVLKEIVEELKKENRTILFSTHILSQAEALCDRIVMVHQGSKVLDNDLESISIEYQKEALQINRPTNPDSFSKVKGIKNITRTNDHDYEIQVKENANLDNIMKELLQLTKCDSITKHRQNLDQIFRSIVKRQESV